MPARIVLPSVSLGTSEVRPLDLEDKLRLAAEKAAGIALDSDALEALVCAACEAVEGDAAKLRSALERAVDDVLQDDADTRRALLDALSAVAESEVDVAPLPAARRPLKGSSVALQRSAPTQTAGRFLRRGQIESMRASEYLQEHAKQRVQAAEEQAAREKELAAYYGRADGEASAADELGAAGGGGGGGDSDSEEDDEEDETTKTDREAMKNRLRELGQPATLFGESDLARIARLKQCELSADQDVLATGSTNVMQLIDRRMAKEAPDSIRAALKDAKDLFLPARPPGDVAPQGGAWSDDDSQDEDALEEPHVSSTDLLGSPADEGDDAAEAVDTDSRTVCVWLRNTLRAWEGSLQERSTEEQNSSKYKVEKAQYRQSKQYLKPLRRSLRDGDSRSRTVIASLAVIAGHCDRRAYKEAKEAYMRLAIGNAAWPMGVTAVTFHDRANRHKISEGSVAHVLDDETTRRYVQMVKRLLTFAELRWPIDPSRAA